MKKEKSLDIHGKPYNKVMLILVLLVGTFCTVLNQTLLTTAIPTLMKTFEVSAVDIQWLTTGFLLVNGIMIPISAWLINSFSSKNLYFSAMFIFLIGTVLCFSAQNFPMILAGRLIQAVGVGASIPMLQTIMLNIFPPEKRGASMGLVGLVIGLAPAIGPTLSGWIVDNYEWRALFGILIPIITLILVLSIFFMKTVVPLHKSKLDVLSVIYSSIGFGSLLYGFSSVGKEGWMSTLVISTILIGLVFIGLFAKRQFTLETPFLDISVFKTPIFAITSVLSGVVSMAMIGAEMVIPMYIQNVHGDSAFRSGLMLLPGALAMGLMMPVTGIIFDKIGAKKLAITGMFVLTVATLPFVFITKTTPNSAIIVLYAIRMIGISMVMMPVTTAGMNALPNHQISHGTAANNTFRQVISSIGTAVLISVLTNVTNKNMPSDAVLKATPLKYGKEALDALLSGYQISFLLATLFSLVGVFLAFSLKGKKETDAMKGAK